MSEIRVAFVGQCHTRGYPGVPPDVAFPRVCREAIEAQRPGVRIEVEAEQYYHPVQLPDAIDAALGRNPKVVVIEVVGWLAIKGSQAIDLSRLPWGVRTAYERATYLRRVARRAARTHKPGEQRIEPVATDSESLAGSFLGSLLPRYPRPTIAEYEASVRKAAIQVRNTEGVACVIQGPGAPNLQLASQSLSSAALEIYRNVHAMAKRVAEEERALFVDRWDTIAAGFFKDGSVRPTSGGHSVWGHLLANELISAGLV